jgi:hypothetical protein
MTEAKLIQHMLTMFEDMEQHNARNVDMLGDWAEGRASAFKLAADHCRNLLLYVLDENVSHLEVTSNSEGEA